MPRTPSFAARFAELVSGGLVIVDGFPDRSDDQVAFRTLIQLDGDVTFSVHAEALAREDFAELLAGHHRHVCEILDQKRSRLTRLGNLFVGGSVAAGLVGGHQAGSGLQGAGMLLLQIPDTLVLYAIASVGGLLFYAFADIGLRAVLRRLAFGRVTWANARD
jgi:hypothetical protein